MKVIIFVDALPYEYVLKHTASLKFVSFSNSMVRLIPELGFSSNQHMAMFYGKLPKDVKYIGDYTLRKDCVDRRLKPLLSHNSGLNYIIRRLSAYFTGRQNNIPIGLGTAFENTGFYPLKNEGNFILHENRYSRYQFHKIDASLDARKTISNVDLSRDQFFVIDEIDHCGHVFGISSDSYLNLIEKLDQFIIQVLTALPVNDFSILSDHGMSDRPTRISLALEDHLGSQGPDSYYYFLDSSICKIWYFNPETKARARELLGQLDTGRLLSDDERDYYGISDELCDDLFALQSTYFFEPQYFGFGLMSKTLGMHGSLPQNNDQHGILLTSVRSSDSVMRNLHVYDWLESAGFL